MIQIFFWNEAENSRRLNAAWIGQRQKLQNSNVGKVTNETVYLNRLPIEKQQWLAAIGGQKMVSPRDQ